MTTISNKAINITKYETTVIGAHQMNLALVVFQPKLSHFQSYIRYEITYYFYDSIQSNIALPKTWIALVFFLLKMNELSLATANMTPAQALVHLKRVVEEAAIAANSTTPKYTSTLLICFIWKEDDVLGSADCEDISNIFAKVYGARVVKLVLEMKEYKPMDVLRLIHPVSGDLLNESQLVVIYYR
jgi:hypothetical protein